MNTSNLLDKSEKKSRIMLFDDSEVDRELGCLLLEKYGMTPLPQPSPVNCLEIIASEAPDLILLDILMPVVSGIQLLREIREKYSSLELPIIMVTAKADALDVVEALKLGTNDFITKPFDHEVAIHRIQTHLIITKQFRAKVDAKELESIHAMIATYSHQINNPLCIALIHLARLTAQDKVNPDLQQIEIALRKIEALVRNTQLVLKKGSVEFEQYSEYSKTLKLKS